MAGEEDTGRRLDEILRAVDTRLDRLESEIERPRATPAVEAPIDRPVETGTGSYVLFVPSASGYELVERDGPAPAFGETIELSGIDGRYAVVKVVRSPLPDDRRPCAYLQLT